MARYAGKNWKRQDLLSYVGDIHQIARVRASVLTGGKADGVRAVDFDTGSGFSFTVLPGRGMDIPFASYKGKSLCFVSGTGITSPGYYDEPGAQWLRSFFGGMLTTCGITNAGAPSVDKGEPFGLHGRHSNSAAEDLCVEQDWEGDEYVMRARGTAREAAALGENLALTRTVEARLGQKGFRLHDRIVNKGFEPQPLMLLYHMNYGFPLLSQGAKIVGPIVTTLPRTEFAATERGVEECLSFPAPIPGCEEKCFYHSFKPGPDGRVFIALVNRDIGDGTPLATVLRWNAKELPCFTEWKMPRQGGYVLGLEPGTITPDGRGVLREQGKLPLLAGQESCSITLDFEVLDSASEIDAMEKEARR